jgi:hypothetical protein
MNQNYNRMFSKCKKQDICRKKTGHLLKNGSTIAKKGGHLAKKEDNW